MKLAGRERLLLVVLLLLLVGLSVRQWKRVGARGELGLGGSRAARQLARSGSVLEVAELRLGELERRTVRQDLGRDPFRFAPARRVTPPDPPPAKRRPKRKSKPKPPSGPRPPTMNLSFLGSFGPEGKTIAVFSDGEAIFNALQGEVVDGKFIVERIDDESVDLRFVGFPDVPVSRLVVGG